MNILVISDNHRLSTYFMSLASETLSDCVIDLCYSARNKSPAAMINLGALAVDLSNQQKITEISKRYSLILSLHCKQIFPSTLVTNVRCVNIHPGFNPTNKGWFPQVFGIINGDVCGVTIHEMNSDVDAGPIIVQQKVHVNEWDTSLEVYERCIDLEQSLLADWLIRIVSGNYEAFQPTSEGNYNGIADFRSLCQIDMGHMGTLRDHINLLRALSHGDFENAWFRATDGRRIYVNISLKLDDK